MKKMVGIAAVLMTTVLVSQAALTVTWGYAGDLNASGKTPPTFTEGWLVQLYQDVNKDSVLGSVSGFSAGGVSVLGGASLSDDVLITSQTDFLATVFGETYWGSDRTWNSLKNFNVYTVVFDAASAGAATQGIVIDSTPFSVPNVDDGFATYTPSVVAGNWVAVPEPGTLALLGIGAMIMGLRKAVRK